MNAADMDIDYKDVPDSDEDGRDDTEMVIVDCGRVYKHKIRWCACRGRPAEHLLLFSMGLFSATLAQPKTAFSFRLLNYFHIDAMECRTSASSFFSKLRRLTNECFPDKVPVSAPILIAGIASVNDGCQGPIYRPHACVSAMAAFASSQVVWFRP